MVPDWFVGQAKLWVCCGWLTLIEKKYYEPGALLFMALLKKKRVANLTEEAST